MEISARVEFTADPDRVFTMVTDQRYLERVCQASHAEEYSASVDGMTTNTSRTLPAPEIAARFTGPTLTVKEQIEWGEAGPDGSRTAKVTLTVPGQPVEMNGRLALTAGGPGTVIELTGELKVSIPLLGRKLEQAAAPAVLAGFDVQQKVGTDWLAATA
ncbi:DUF2505 domain-containing protein [Microlunatus parietis]|uniref:Carbon monoxide dehydrogenase subunit G n=1 Tax=Microlunatus parietis TaxID=682979 RepID=A0A7Y9LAM1_9ACTN|nr:DUF2505 domain-containing protein [Microlunatus parietis]NYE69735.1 hypothetical protein [Microlunatus parietis]